MLWREHDYKKILDDHNKKEFNAKGVDWKIGPMGAWAEANHGGPLRQPVVAPTYTSNMPISKSPTNVVRQSSPPLSPVRVVQPSQPVRVVQPTYQPTRVISPTPGSPTRVSQPYGRL